MTLGEKLRQARKSCGLSQGQLADKLCVSRSAIAKWETDKGLPDVENLKQLSRLLHVSLDTLLNDTEDASPTVRERYDPAQFGRGCNKVRQDRMMAARFPGARVCTLLGRQDLSVQNAAPHSTLGFLTPVPFGPPEYVKTVREMDRNFYLAERENEQLFVSVTEEFLEIHPLPQRIDAASFTLGSWHFIRSSYLTDQP